MSALATRLHAGDVIEVDLEGDSATALVLLATHEFVILDPCDGRTPIVVRSEDLGPVRVFTDHL
ncbi:MAG: hypothetical protein RL238_1543 [Actinomycetota bacterium]|jgi:hypothetical protein